MTVNQRYSVFDVTTPPNTPVDAPQTVELDLGDVRLDRIDWRIPPGPSGLCGAAIVQAGTNLWPWGPTGSFLVGDDEYDKVPIGTEVDQGVTIVTYNLDAFPHTWYFKFLYTPIALVVASSRVTPIVAIS